MLPPLQRADDVRLQARLEDLRRSFLDRDADAFQRLLSTRGRVFLSISDLAPEQGFYGTSQVQTIFARIGRDTRTEKFELLPDDIREIAPGVAYAKIRWTYRVLSEDVSRTQTLYFSLKDEAGEWRITEIKTAR